MSEIALIRDIGCSEVEPAEVRAGLELVSRIGGVALGVMPQEYSVNLESQGRSALIADAVTWPPMPTPLSVIMTDRQVYRRNPETRNLELVCGLAFTATGLAIVSSFRGQGRPRGKAIREITAHEVGHQLAVHSNTPTTDQLHCTNQHCIMYPETALAHKLSTRLDFSMPTRLNFKLFGNPDLMAKAEAFCTGCQESLKANAPSVLAWHERRHAEGLMTPQNQSTY